MVIHSLISLAAFDFCSSLFAFYLVEFYLLFLFLFYSCSVFALLLVSCYLVLCTFALYCIVWLSDFLYFVPLYSVRVFDLFVLRLICFSLFVCVLSIVSWPFLPCARDGLCISLMESCCSLILYPGRNKDIMVFGLLICWYYYKAFCGAGSWGFFLSIMAFGWELCLPCWRPWVISCLVCL